MRSWRDSGLRLTRHALRLTLVCLLFAGCALLTAKPEAPALRQATAEELTTLLRQREAAIMSLKGLFSAKVRGGILPIATRVEGAVYYQRPDAMRLRGFTPVGSELFEFLQAGDQYVLRLPTMGRVLSGTNADTKEMGKLERPFQLSVWAMGGVLGTGTVAADETVKLHEDGDRYRLDIFGPSSPASNGAEALRRRLWFDRQTFLVVKEERLTESGEVDASIQYDDFRPVGDAAALPAASSAVNEPLLRPFKISLEDGKGRGAVQVTFHEIIPNQPIKPSELGRS
ncbi:MAG TPA: hypothetical protein VFS39_01800 [Nitrospira sp.]|nr:hypothetical protein [Nitrospira sp.]